MDRFLRAKNESQKELSFSPNITKSQQNQNGISSMDHSKSCILFKDKPHQPNNNLLKPINLSQNSKLVRDGNLYRSSSDQ